MQTGTIEHVASKDAAWFAVHSDRCLRMRLAEPAEIARIKGRRPIPDDVRHTVFGIRGLTGEIISVPTALSANVDPARLTEAECFQVLNLLLLQDRGLERRLVEALFGGSVQ